MLQSCYLYQIKNNKFHVLLQREKMSFTYYDMQTKKNCAQVCRRNYLASVAPHSYTGLPRYREFEIPSFQTGKHREFVKILKICFTQGIDHQQRVNLENLELKNELVILSKKSSDVLLDNFLVIHNM